MTQEQLPELPEMLEAVAETIYNNLPADQAWEQLPEETRTFWRDLAQKAITAYWAARGRGG